MLDTRGLDQCAGLRQWATSLSPVIITVVHHGDLHAEMTALWQICAHLQRLGYPLSVLDVTATEGPGMPGLQDMLIHANRPSPATDGAWSVVPAATGLRQLASMLSPAETVEQALSHLFLDFGAVVVYADADTLNRCMNGPHAYPVIPISPDAPSLLSAYASLKKLGSQGPVQHAALVTVRSDQGSLQIARRIAKSLQNCTMKHLRCRLHHFDICSSFEPDTEPVGVRQLIMDLLDRSHTATGGIATTHRLWSH